MHNAAMKAPNTTRQVLVKPMLLPTDTEKLMVPVKNKSIINHVRTQEFLQVNPEPKELFCILFTTRSKRDRTFMSGSGLAGAKITRRVKCSRVKTVANWQQSTWRNATASAFCSSHTASIA
jgi:hypothetical protein